MQPVKTLAQLYALLLVFTCAFAQPAPQHDLHFETLANAWDEGIPLGNGMIGALIWQKQDHLRFALDRADLWDERPMKGLHRKEFSYQWVYEQVKKNDYKVVQQYFDVPYDKEAAPAKISGGALEFDSKDWGAVQSVYLSIKNATCAIKWSNGTVLKTFVHATQPVGWFRFENIATGFVPEIKVPGYANTKSLPLDSLKSNDPAKLGYARGTIIKGKNSILYSQPGWNGFFYQIAVRWKKVNATTIEGTWSISSNFNKTSKTAEKIIKQAAARGYEADELSHKKWWTNFWSKSELHVPDSVLEKQWYRDQYKFGSVVREGTPPILLQGVWTADNGRLPPWKGDYHHDLNTEMSYWPSYSANHLSEAMSFIHHLEENKTNYRRYTQLYFGSPGLNVPGTSTLKGNEMGGWIPYALSPTVACWLSQHYYLQWKYSMDPVFLKKQAYPWLKEVADYIEHITVKKDDGFRELPISSSPEINNNSIGAWFPNTTNYDLSLMKFTFKAASEMAEKLNLLADIKKYKKIEAEFRDYALSLNNELMYAPDSSYKESHRHFSNAMAIHPLGLIRWEDGEKAQSIIRNTIALFDKYGPDNWNGYSYAWLANMKARAKDGEGAAKALQIFASAFCSVNSFHVNGDQTKSGFSTRTYRPFTLEGNFAFAAGLQEMLLQSHGESIEVMPAIPASWNDVSFTSLRAEGAFLVSAKRTKGKLREIKILAEKGGHTKLTLTNNDWYVASARHARLLANNNGFADLSFAVNGEIILRCK